MMQDSSFFMKNEEKNGSLRKTLLEANSLIIRDLYLFTIHNYLLLAKLVLIQKLKTQLQIHN